MIPCCALLTLLVEMLFYKETIVFNVVKLCCHMWISNFFIKQFDRNFPIFGYLLTLKYEKSFLECQRATCPVW